MLFETEAWSGGGVCFSANGGSWNGLRCVRRAGGRVKRGRVRGTDGLGKRDGARRFVLGIAGGTVSDYVMLKM